MTAKNINKKKTSNGIPIRRWLIIPAVIVLLLFFGVIGSFFIQSSLKNSLIILEDLQSHMEEHVNEEIIQRFEKVEKLNQINEDMLKGGILDIESQEEREIYFSNIFKSYPEIAMLYIGLTDGSFYGIRRNPDGERLIVRNNKSTNGASQYYSTNELGVGVRLEEEFPNFDPRTRPWYLSAVEEGKPTYSDVYMHFVFKEPTITSSRPIYDENNQLIGVFGANYLLTWMDEFLDELLIGKNGQIFITDDEDRVLASTLDMETYTVNSEQLELLNVNELNNQYIQESIDALKNMDKGEKQSVIIGGKKYYIGFVDLNKNDLKWKFHFLIMEDDFLGNTKAAIFYVILLLIFFIFVSIGIFAWLARKITKPIEELTTASERLSDGYLEPIDNIERIDELYRLTNSFNKMGKKLSNMVADLESKVTIRTYELECANKELEKLSFIDGLTGIYNRRKFDESYSIAWNNARRYGRKLGILMIDIDYFKHYNDTYGHLKGDDCLKSIANKLVKSLRRSTDLVARYGGEEFVILFQELEEDKIEDFADKIRKGVEGLKIEHSTSEFGIVTISIGIAYMTPMTELDLNDLIENADKALYKAKETGRNKIYMYRDKEKEGIVANNMDISE